MLSESEASERAYVDYRRELSLRYGSLAVVAVGGTTLVTWPTDLLIFGDRPEVLRGFVMWRGGLIAVLVLLLLAIRLGQRSRRLSWVDWVSGVVFVLVAVVFGASLAELGGIASTWFVAAYFVPFSTFVLVVPLRTRIAIVVSTLGALLGTYFAWEPAHARHPELWSVIISLVSAAGFAILIGMVWERRTWRLFEQQRRLAGHNRELERQVGERARALQRLARHVTSAREEERTRIARELHDDSGALLTAMRLQVADARRRIGSSARDNLDRLDDLIDQSFEANGRLVEALRPAVLDELGLTTTLERLCGTVESGSGLTIIRDLDPGADRYPDVATTVFRLVQEALTNVTRHAGASRTELRVRVEDRSLLVEVEDDGVGFDRDAVAHDRFGLLGMSERVAGLDGRLEIDSRPGEGTRIFATLPLPAVPAEGCA